MKQIEVAGILVTVEKKRIKNMYLRLHPDGSAKLTAPLGLSDAAIAAFLESRSQWLVKQRENLAQAIPQQPATYENGESHRLWGQSYPLVLLPGNGHCIAECTSGQLLLHNGLTATPQQRKTALDALYRQQLLTALPPLRRQCEEIVGQQAAEVRVRDMHTRWGSCNVPKRRIWLSLHLAEYPPDCLRCVLIHELTHLWERRHNARFWGFMDRFCPDWRTIHRQLGGPHGK